MTYSIIHLSTMVFIFCACNVVAQSNAQITQESDLPVAKYNTKKLAIEQVSTIVGLGDTIHIAGPDDNKIPSLKAQLVILKQDKTPFLRDEYIGKAIWHVTISDWQIQLPSAPKNQKDRYPRIFDVYLDPVDGKLIEILSRWPTGVPPIAPMPPAKEAERQMFNGGAETYHSFPEEPPLITFAEALDVVSNRGTGHPYATKQILGHYVIHSYMGKKPKPVWAITLWGIPPYEASHPNVPISARNHMRNVIDARNGEWMFADSAPQPVDDIPTQNKQRRYGTRPVP